jgi:hypothetical protein
MSYVLERTFKEVAVACLTYSPKNFQPRVALASQRVASTEGFQLPDLQLSGILPYPTCRVIMVHSQRLNSTQTAPACVGQQRKATATDVIMHEAQQQIPATNFLRKYTFSFSN